MWYVARDGKRIGPVSEQQILNQWNAGKLLPSDLVWSKDTIIWQRIDECLFFSKLFQKSNNINEGAKTLWANTSEGGNTISQGASKYWHEMKGCFSNTRGRPILFGFCLVATFIIYFLTACIFYGGLFFVGSSILMLALFSAMTIILLPVTLLLAILLTLWAIPGAIIIVFMMGIVHHIGMSPMYFFAWFCDNYPSAKEIATFVK